MLSSKGRELLDLRQLNGGSVLPSGPLGDTRGSIPAISAASDPLRLNPLILVLALEEEEAPLASKG